MPTVWKGHCVIPDNTAMNAGLTPTSTSRFNEGQASTRHWVIAYAAQESDALQKAIDTLYLPNLQKLFSRMACVTKSSSSAEGLSAFLMPHEAVPKLFGVEPVLGKAATMTPCHWQIGMNEVILLKPEEVGLSDSESRQLLSVMQPYFEEDGLHVVYESPLVWGVTGDLLADLPMASIDRVIGQRINAWMPDLQKAKKLQRLQSEMQMLLYQHPVNDERSLKGQWTVNSFWLHRRLDQLYPQATHFAVALDLRDAAQGSNPKLWQQAWAHIDNTLALSLCQALDLKQDVSLTLCSETSMRHYQARPSSWLDHLQRVFKPITVRKELRALSTGVANP